jgi:hypothetical protein
MTEGAELFGAIWPIAKARPEPANLPLDVSGVDIHAVL